MAHLLRMASQKAPPATLYPYPSPPLPSSLTRPEVKVEGEVRAELTLPRHIPRQRQYGRVRNLVNGEWGSESREAYSFLFLICGSPSKNGHVQHIVMCAKT